MRRRVLSIAAAICMTATLLAGCGGGNKEETTAASVTAAETAQAVETADPGEPQNGGILYVNDTSNKAVIGYPAKVTSASALRHVVPCIETLFRYDESGSPAPYLAESYETDVENLTLTIKVKDGIVFHDGTPFDAEAVKWNFDEQMTAGASSFSNFESVEVVDNSTVVVHLTTWNNALLSQLCSYAGMMISPKACQDNGVDWAMNNPVGTGPFKFVEWEKDVKIVYEKFEDYWQDGLPYLDGVEVSFTADDTSRELSTRNGEIDVLIQGNTTSIENLVAAGFVKSSIAAGTGGQSLVPDSKNPDSPWADVRVRQAAAHAINTDALVDGVLGGFGVKTNQYSYPGHWGYNEDVQGYAFDVEKAKALLAEAGYANGFDTSLTYNASSDDADLVATTVQSMLGQIGIKVELKPVQDALHVEMERQGGGWDGLLQIGANPNPDTAEQMKARLWDEATWFSSMQHPDAMLAAIDDALAAAEFDDKQAKVWEVQEIMYDEQCLMIPLYISMDTSVMSTNVHDANFSAGLPAVIWTPEKAWKAQ